MSIWLYGRKKARQRSFYSVSFSPILIMLAVVVGWLLLMQMLTIFL